MSRIILLDPKLTPHVNFSNFQAEENFFDVLMTKEQQQTPLLINFAKIWSECVLTIKTKSHQVWAL